MNDALDPNWKPDPQLWAAYFDGELEGRDDMADTRARLEAWLERHPEAVDEWARHQRLSKVWLDTTPADPSATAWNQTLARIDARRRAPLLLPASKRPWLMVGMVAACVVVLAGLLFGALRSWSPTGVQNQPFAVVPKEKPTLEPEIFPVATADEVRVLHIEGADTSALVVGLLPIHGPLELAAPGEVNVRHVWPDADDNMIPTIRHQGRPMIWARLETD